MARDTSLHDRAMVRLATVIGIPLYAVFGGVGLWLATRLWNRLVCDDVLMPSVLGGTTAAIGAASAVAITIGIAGVSSLSRGTFERAASSPARGTLVGAGIGVLAALGPSILIVIGCQHLGAGIVATTTGLVVPSALTGAAAVALLGPATRSRSLRRLLVIAKWLSVVLVALWAVISFAPLDRWMILACSVG